MNWQQLRNMNSSSCQTIIILSLLLCTSIVRCSTSDFYSDSEFWDDDDDAGAYGEPVVLKESSSPEMQGLVCYECSENVKDFGHMTCDLTRDEIDYGQIFEDNPAFADEMIAAQEFGGGVEDLLIQKFLSAKETNPCKIVTNRVLELVESKTDDLIPIYLDPKGKDSKMRYEALKEAISTIQFQKRESDFVAVEVQFRNKDDTFSFILPNFELELMNIPHNSVFYTSL